VFGSNASFIILPICWFLKNENPFCGSLRSAFECGNQHFPGASIVGSS